MTEVSFDAVTPETLLALRKGDVIEVPGLLPGLDPEEPVLAQVAEKEKGYSTFRFTYNGVWLGNAKLFIGNDKRGPQWQTQ
jgi:hypothetical protein